jgi:deazaflavin-dependent oxidoreductase (nitroreductase family)
MTAHALPHGPGFADSGFADSELADPPPGARQGDPLPPSARAFRWLNRWLMIPALRAGLGQWLSTPIGGCLLLLRVRGRKSGAIRETPLNYLITDGAVWIVAGFGPRSDWYRNLLAEPRVEAWLPGRRIAGTAVEVRAPGVRQRILPALMRSTGAPALGSGVNPWRETDEAVAQHLAWVPLIRIDPDEGWLDSGPDDPGGHAWIWRQALALGLSWLAWRSLRRVLR